MSPYFEEIKELVMDKRDEYYNNLCEIVQCAVGNDDITPEEAVQIIEMI